MSLQKRINELLRKAADNIIKDAKANLEDGELKDSLKVKPTKNSIEIIMSEYGIFKDKGVTGANHADFIGKNREVYKSKANFKFTKRVIRGENSIDKWMYKKGIQGRDKKGRFIKRTATNFLIRRSIAQHGIKPSLFLTTPFKKYNEQIKKEFKNLSKGLITDINKDIKKK